MLQEANASWDCVNLFRWETFYGYGNKISICIKTLFAMLSNNMKIYGQNLRLLCNQVHIELDNNNYETYYNEITVEFTFPTNLFSFVKLAN